MMSTLLMSAEATLLLSVAALYIVQCPFNKVEESFNTQAVHDIINIFPNNIPSINTTTQDDKTLLDFGTQHEISIRSHLSWDHTQFPGVVPRTFIGALMVGLPMRFAKYFMIGGVDETLPGDEHDLTAQFILQIGSRFVLSSFMVLSLSILLRAIQKRYGLSYRLCFLIITVSQFHYLFYAGRFLPNTFAAIFANLIFASWINRQLSKAVLLIAPCVVIFRFDTSLMFGWLLFDAIFIRKLLPLSRLFTLGIPAGLVSVIVSFVIDSIFWARPVWPEFDGLYFNIWLNLSHQWGVQPYFWYVYNCIPRIMMTSTPLILLAENKFTRNYLIPTLAFIISYSFLPHKEMRFILFVAPLLNLCAASGLLNVYYYLNKFMLYLRSRINNNDQAKNTQSSKGSPRRGLRSNANPKTEQLTGRSHLAIFLFALIVVGMFLANLFACFILARISSHNYPGGQAALSLGVTKELLDTAKKSLDNTSGLRDLRSNAAVYVDNLAAQTGMSRFVQVNGVYYSKTPKLDDSTFKNTYNLIYLILEPKEIEDQLLQYCSMNHRAGLRDWASIKDSIRCKLPNQSEMYCSIVDTTKSLRSINLAAVLRKPTTILDDNTYIRTKVALHIIRCSAENDK